MRFILGMLIGILTFLPAALAQTPVTPVRKLAWAIAKQEGFFVKGSLSNRDHNPGDLKSCKSCKSGKSRYPGQIGVDRHGHAIFKNDDAGWAALQSLIRRMACGESLHYSPQMSLSQVGRIYARDKKWAVNVSHYLGCTPTVTLAQLLNPDPDELERHEVYLRDKEDLRRVLLLL
jgi:hypothetical protein